MVIIEGREEGRDRHKSHVHVHNNKHSQQIRGGGDDITEISNLAKSGTHK